MVNHSKHDSRDPLTGLLDGDAALEVLARWQEHVPEGEAAPIHAMLLRLKRFSAVNLEYGETAGDKALVEIAARISAFARVELGPQWLAARLRGGTFLLAARDACSPRAVAVAGRGTGAGDRPADRPGRRAGHGAAVAAHGPAARGCR